jgi:hypothetical protein
MVRPRYEEASSEAYEMLAKAQELLEKADKLHMVEHDGKKVPHFAADGKGDKDAKKKASMAEKDKYCMKNFGKKYSECSEKQKAQCDRVHGKVEKGEHHKATTFDTRPGNVQFMSESGGQTFNAQYQTNQSLLDADDVANKGASSSSVDMDMESSMRNPHDNIDRLVEG